jgi:hypothetical protein
VTAETVAWVMVVALSILAGSAWYSAVVWMRKAKRAEQAALDAERRTAMVAAVGARALAAASAGLTAAQDAIDRINAQAEQSNTEAWVHVAKLTPPC